MIGQTEEKKQFIVGHWVVACDRDSMPPEMFRTLKPFCIKIRVALPSRTNQSAWAPRPRRAPAHRVGDRPISGTALSWPASWLPDNSPRGSSGRDRSSRNRLNEFASLGRRPAFGASRPYGRARHTGFSARPYAAAVVAVGGSTGSAGGEHSPRGARAVLQLRP